MEHMERREDMVNKKLEGLKDFKNTVRCAFKVKPPCHWVKESGLCGYPPTGPHLFDGVCHTYSPRSEETKDA